MAITIVKQPKNVTALVGNTATFAVEATGDNLTYQWQYSSNGTTWQNSPLTGATTSTLPVPATESRNGMIYRCVITDASGDSVTSDAATLTVREAVVTIIKQPTDITAIVGTTAKFAVLVEGDVNGYNWQIKKPTDSGWAGTTMTGNKTACLEIPAATSRNGYMYRCIITDSSGNQYITDEVTLTVIDVGFINHSTMQGIADAIRTKTETTDAILPADMAAMIEGIETGGFNIMSGSATPSSNTDTLSLGATLPESDNYLFICVASIFGAFSLRDSSALIYTHYLRRVVITNTDGVSIGSVSRTTQASEYGASLDYVGGTLNGDSLTFSDFTNPLYRFRTSIAYMWWYAYE